MSSNPRCAVLGLGLMGRAMAERLGEAGLLQAAWNRSPVPSPSSAIALSGSAAAAVGEAEHVLLMLTDGRATEAVLADGLEAGLRPGQVVINLATVGAQWARALAVRVERRGAAYLDAPVLGSTGAARRGELIVMVGGPREVLDRAESTLAVLAKSVHHTGEVGTGSRLKLILNMLLARYVEALGEWLALSEAFALDPHQVLRVLDESALSSPMWGKARALLDDKLPLHFPLKHMTKDLRLLDEEIERAGLSLPAAEAVQSSFEEALQSGWGDGDYSLIANWIRRRGRG